MSTKPETQTVAAFLDLAAVTVPPERLDEHVQMLHYIRGVERRLAAARLGEQAPWGAQDDA